MKALLTITSSPFGLLDDKSNLKVHAEVTMVFVEPTFDVNGQGKPVGRNTTSQVTFTASPEGLSQLAEAFLKMSEEAGKMAAAHVEMVMANQLQKTVQE